jgi:hypothetical protein
MAEVVAISLQVDSGQSVQEVKKLEDAIKDVQKTTNSSNVEEKFNSLNQAIDRGEGSVEDLRKAIKSYQTIALSAGRTSPIGQEALKRSADLKDKLTDLDNEVKRLSQDGKNLQGALQIGQSAVAGYQAMTSITALLGVENEELMKTMVKLQATMSLLQAIEQIRLATEKESQAMLFIKNAQTKIGIVLQKAYALAVGTGTKAMKSFRGALIATGLGALVVLIGTIIAKWDDWKDSILKIIRVAFYPFIKVLESLGVIENDLDRARQLNSEKQLKRIRQEQDLLKEIQGIQEDNLRHEISVAQARGENTEELEKKLLQETANGALARIKLNQKEIDEIMQSQKEGNEERLSELYDFIEADNKAIEKAKRDAELFRAKKETEERNERQRNWEKRKQEKQKEFEEELQMLRDKMQKELDMEEEMQDLIIENMEDEDAKTLAKLQLQQERELAALRDKYGIETELEIELLKKQARELNEVKKQIAQESKDEMDEMANFFEQEEDARRDNEVAKNIQATKAQLTNLEETEKAKQQVRVDGLNATGDVLNALGSLFNKNEKVQKATALAQIGIDTAKAISSLVANSQANPANAVTGGVAGAIQFATGIAQILSNIAKAKQLLGASSGGAGGSGVTPPSISRPNPTTTTSGTAPTGNNNNGRTDIPTTKVVLVESELQAMQTRRSQVDTIATI